MLETLVLCSGVEPKAKARGRILRLDTIEAGPGTQHVKLKLGDITHAFSRTMPNRLADLLEIAAARRRS